jgi:hypothetical protein
MGALNPSPRTSSSSKTPAQIVAAQLGQHEIEDHEVGSVFADRPVTGLAVNRCQDLVRLEPEVVPQPHRMAGSSSTIRMRLMRSP